MNKNKILKPIVLYSGFPTPIYDNKLFEAVYFDEKDTSLVLRCISIRRYKLRWFV